MVMHSATNEFSQGKKAICRQRLDLASAIRKIFSSLANLHIANLKLKSGQHAIT